jgi:hypothetical protein
MNEKDQEYNEEDGLTPEEELNAENELELLRLNLEYGAESYISEDAPPELVRQFLQNIKEWEASIKDEPEMTFIWDILRDHEYPMPDDVEPDRIEEVIEAFLQLLLDNGIIIDRPSHLSAYEFYDFFTCELLEEEVLALRPPGFIHGLLYSDIKKDHPDVIPDIASEEVLDIYFHNPYDGYHIGPESHMQHSYEEVLDLVKAWRLTNNAVRFNGVAVDEVIEHDDHHIVTLDVGYIDVMEEEVIVMAVVKVEKIEDEYFVTHVKLPGLEL